VSDITGSPSNYSFKVDTTTMTDGNYYLKVTSTDVAGNEGSELGKDADAYFKVLQASDKPKVTFNVNDGDVVIPPYTITGTAFDDDGFSTAYQFRYVLKPSAAPSDSEIRESANTINTKNAGTFSFSLPKDSVSGNGTWHLGLIPTDKNGVDGDIYRVSVTASTDNNPSVSNVTFSQADGGTYYAEAETYAGKLTINASVTSQKDDQFVRYVAYRLSCAGVEKSDNTIDISALTPTFDASKKGYWYYKAIAGDQYELIDTVVFNTKDLISGNGQLTLEVKVIADNGTSPTVRASVVIDNEKPTVNISTPTADTTIDGMATFSGTLRESGSSIKHVYISYYDEKTWTDDQINNLTVSDFSSAVANGNPPEINKWLELGAFTTSWNYEYKSTVLTDESVTEIVVAAVDQLDNVGAKKVKVKVSQDNDRPIVNVTNMDLTEKKTDSGKYIANTQGSLICSIADDDGTVNSVWYSTSNHPIPVDGLNGDWGTPKNKVTMFTISGLEDGNRDVYIRVQDGKGTDFVSKLNPSTVADAISAIILKD
ncbi:MAG: hypothetical protein J6W76_00240, partial [Spirochaetales bacterium]|nr:hypothetical protein [Spirochaetales bacterium]